MLYDQFAIVVNDSDKVINEYKSIGYDEWVRDIVIGEGEINGNAVSNTLELNYNYQMGSYEFEVLKVISGKTFQDLVDKPGISHFGQHVDNMDAAVSEYKANGYKYIGFIKTKKHLNTKNLYHYVFLENEKIGVFLKLIKRIATAAAPTEYSPTIHYMDVIHRAKMLRDKKVKDYGTKRYQVSSRQFDEMMCFSDVYRKFIRLEEHYKNFGQKLNYESIKDTYMDLLNYSALAIQVIELLEAKGRGEQ